MVAHSHQVLVVGAREKCLLFSKECSFAIVLQSTRRGKKKSVQSFVQKTGVKSVN
jgi:hypothetical protein